MIRLTLRTLLAYLDDTLSAADAKVIGQKLAENESARQLADRIRTLTRKRSLSTPATGAEGSSTDPNTVAAYLSDTLSPDLLAQFEQVSLESDAQLAELAACHQILTILLSDQVRVPPTAYRRMYGLVKGKEAIPGRVPNRQTLPVGGVLHPEHPHDADESDAAYLLGMPAYSRSEPASRKAMRWAVAGLLAVGFVIAAWLAWPTGPAPTNDAAVARTTPTTPETPPTRTVPTTPPTTPMPKEDPTPNPNPMPAPKEDPTPNPMPEPKQDLGEKQPPIEKRVPVGVSAIGDDRVLLAKKATDGTWVRVAKGAEIQATDRLVCLPGYRTPVAFKPGLSAELWGNIPSDLSPVPVFETALTPYVPYDGFATDFTLHSGRIYLENTQDSPVKVRVRLRDPKFQAKDQQWDITLPDNRSKLVLEVQHLLTPGVADDPPQTLAFLFSLEGELTLPIKRVPVTLKAGELLVYDSVRGEVQGPSRPTDETDTDSAYFSRDQIYPDAGKARAMLTALGAFADRVKEVNSVPGVTAEFRAQPTGPVGPDYFSGAVLSVFVSAALGDLPELADLLNDPNRQGLRAAAFVALRGLLAAAPDRLEEFRKIATGRWELKPDAAETLLNTLAGVQPNRRRDPDTLKKLVEGLTAPQVAQREAALFVLLTEIDPTAQQSPGLVYDVAGNAEVRQGGQAAWEARVKELLEMKR